MAKKRLDTVLVERDFATDLHGAAALLMSGVVIVNGQKAEKPGTEIDPEAEIRLTSEPLKYVSRGGLKLEAPLEQFGLDLDQSVCIDLGASTGGFTDCLLQHGARRVYAFDVGRGQLHWKLQKDPRVIIRDRFNVRNLTRADVDEEVDLITGDLSFISLRLILPVLLDFPESLMLLLVKPQFEADPSEVEAGGLIRSAKKRQEILCRIKSFSEKLGYDVLDELPSPIRGQKGNLENFLLLRVKEVQKGLEGPA